MWLSILSNPRVMSLHRTAMALMLCALTLTPIFVSHAFAGDKKKDPDEIVRHIAQDHLIDVLINVADRVQYQPPHKLRPSHTA